MKDWTKTRRVITDVSRSLRIAHEDLEYQVANIDDPTDEQTTLNVDTIEEIVTVLREHARNLSALIKDGE
jgi:hypothetical protein